MNAPAFSDAAPNSQAALATYIFPTVAIPQPGGALLVKPGKAIECPKEIRVSEFARLTKLSVSRANQLCVEGLIKSRRMSPADKSMRLIPYSEVARFLGDSCRD